MLYEVVFGFLLSVGSALAANYGDACLQNSGCPAGTYCEIVSPSCGKGTCQCRPGYSMDSGSGTCMIAANLGSACSGTTTCTAANSQCTSGTCQCMQGYKQGPMGDCVTVLMTNRYNGVCYDSVQCYYNMVCIDNKCTCASGYRLVGDYACTPRNPGDVCSTNDDCLMASGTTCSNGVCACSSGTSTKYYTSGTQSATACTSSAGAAEGASCNVTSGTVCKAPLVCTSCTNSGNVCGRIVPLYSSATSPEAIISAILSSAMLAVGIISKL